MEARDTVVERIALDRIAEVAVRVLQARRYDRESDPRTGAARIVLEPSDFAP